MRDLRIFANSVAKKNVAESDALFYRFEESSGDFQVFILRMNLIKNTKFKPYILIDQIDGIFEYKKEKEYFNEKCHWFEAICQFIFSTSHTHTHTHSHFQVFILPMNLIKNTTFKLNIA